MKILVTYYSESGNTKKLAQAIYDIIEEPGKEILPVQDVQSVNDYDLVFCGFPVQASTVPGKMAKFLKNMQEGKKVAIFATHGSLRGGQLATTAFEYAASLPSKASILGTFGCRGKVKSEIIDALMKQPEHKAWAEEAQSAVTHPDEADLEDGREFARRMINKARSK